MKEVYKNLEFVFDEENGTTICVMKYDNRDFMGTAVCAPEDMDYLSKKTGQEIAFNRASVEVLKYEIRNYPFIKLSEKYGVSDNAIRKWCKFYNLPYKSTIIKNISDKDWLNI